MLSMLMASAVGTPLMISLIVLIVTVGLLVVVNGFTRQIARDKFIERAVAFGLIGILGTWVMFLLFTGLQCLHDDHVADINRLQSVNQQLNTYIEVTGSASSTANMYDGMWVGCATTSTDLCHVTITDRLADPADTRKKKR